MVFPGSDWLERFQKASPDVLLSIGVAALAVWFLDLYGLPWPQFAFVFCGFAATLLGIVKIAGLSIRTLIRTVRRWDDNRLKRSFDKHSEEQQRLLRSVFATGSQEFGAKDRAISLRWFEDLITWNYVEHKGRSRRYGDLPYRVTEKGWQELERKLSR